MLCHPTVILFGLEQRLLLLHLDDDEEMNNYTTIFTCACARSGDLVPGPSGESFRRSRDVGTACNRAGGF